MTSTSPFRKHRLFPLFLLVLLAFSSHEALAQKAPTASKPTPPSAAELRVATRVIAPFVMEKNGQLTGFSIELWRQIALQMNVKTRFSVQPNVKAIIKGVQEQREDVGIAAISITAARERAIDFSQPMFESGLQILTRGEASKPSLLTGLMGLLQSPLMKQFAFAIAVLILVPAHLLWLIERRHDEGIIRHKSYYPGIFEAGWWTVSCLATQSEEMPKAVLARFMAVVWMFFAIIFTAYVTAALTANLTLQSLRGDIQGPGDLPGKHVATLAGSTSEDYLRDSNANVAPFSTIEQALAALSEGKVQAVVYDAPILAYYANSEGKNDTQLVGPVFRPESYGIAVQNNSAFRKRINLALLTLREDGTYDTLRAKYFGDPGSQ